MPEPLPSLFCRLVPPIVSATHQSGCLPLFTLVLINVFILIRTTIPIQLFSTMGHTRNRARPSPPFLSPSLDHSLMLLPTTAACDSAQIINPLFFTCAHISRQHLFVFS